jgi:hypothetical protein
MGVGQSDDEPESGESAERAESPDERAGGAASGESAESAAAGRGTGGAAGESAESAECTESKESTEDADEAESTEDAGASRLIWVIRSRSSMPLSAVDTPAPSPATRIAPVPATTSRHGLLMDIVISIRRESCVPPIVAAVRETVVWRR